MVDLGDRPARWSWWPAARVWWARAVVERLVADGCPGGRADPRSRAARPSCPRRVWCPASTGSTPAPCSRHSASPAGRLTAAVVALGGWWLGPQLVDLDLAHLALDARVPPDLALAGRPRARAGAGRRRTPSTSCSVGPRRPSRWPGRARERHRRRPADAAAHAAGRADRDERVRLHEVSVGPPSPTTTATSTRTTVDRRAVAAAVAAVLSDPAAQPSSRSARVTGTCCATRTCPAGSSWRASSCRGTSPRDVRDLPAGSRPPQPGGGARAAVGLAAELPVPPTSRAGTPAAPRPGAGSGVPGRWVRGGQDPPARRARARRGPDPAAGVVYGTFVEYTHLVGALGFAATVKALSAQRLVCIDEFELDDPGDTVLMARLAPRGSATPA